MTRHSRSLIAAAAFCIAMISSSEAQSRKIKGTYENYAEGFAVTIPGGLEGVAGDQAGPERGVGITALTGGAISVWGEPNSLEWKTPEDGIRWVLSNDRCGSSAGKYTITPARIGRMAAKEGRSQCGNRVFRYMLAFRPKGGPIYWFRLETSVENETSDVLTLRRIASTFRLVAWK